MYEDLILLRNKKRLNPNKTNDIIQKDKCKKNDVIFIAGAGGRCLFTFPQNRNSGVIILNTALNPGLIYPFHCPGDNRTSPQAPTPSQGYRGAPSPDTGVHHPPDTGLLLT